MIWGWDGRVEAESRYSLRRREGFVEELYLLMEFEGKGVFIS